MGPWRKAKQLFGIKRFSSIPCIHLGRLNQPEKPAFSPCQPFDWQAVIVASPRKIPRVVNYSRAVGNHICSAGPVQAQHRSNDPRNDCEGAAQWTMALPILSGLSAVARDRIHSKCEHAIDFLQDRVLAAWRGFCEAEDGARGCCDAKRPIKCATVSSAPAPRRTNTAKQPPRYNKSARRPDNFVDRSEIRASRRNALFQDAANCNIAPKALHCVCHDEVACAGCADDICWFYGKESSLDHRTESGHGATRFHSQAGVQYHQPKPVKEGRTPASPGGRESACEQPYSGVRSTAASDAIPFDWSSSGAPEPPPASPWPEPIAWPTDQRSHAADFAWRAADWVSVSCPAQESLPVAVVYGQLGRSMSNRASSSDQSVSSHRHHDSGNVGREEAAR
jgi:hypothetical protein